MSISPPFGARDIIAMLLPEAGDIIAMSQPATRDIVAMSLLSMVSDIIAV